MNLIEQPPSGACVLKHDYLSEWASIASAAFRRLCVETACSHRHGHSAHPAAFRRLCVETEFTPNVILGIRPAAFRRLCVETKNRGEDFLYL